MGKPAGNIPNYVARIFPASAFMLGESKAKCNTRHNSCNQQKIIRRYYRGGAGAGKNQLRPGQPPGRMHVKPTFRIRRKRRGSKLHLRRPRPAGLRRRPHCPGNQIALARIPNFPRWLPFGHPPAVSCRSASSHANQRPSRSLHTLCCRAIGDAITNRSRIVKKLWRMKLLCGKWRKTGRFSYKTHLAGCPIQPSFGLSGDVV